MALLKNPINQMPIPHGLRDNYILKPISGVNFWLIPMGALILAIPFIAMRGAAERRLRPLLAGWYLTMLLGLGGTTPVGKNPAGTCLRSADLRALHLLGHHHGYAVRRHAGHRTDPALPHESGCRAGVAAVLTMASAVSWITIHPINSSPFNVDQVIAFLNRDDHAKFRYITLGFGSKFAEVST